MIRNKTPISAILALCSENILDIPSNKYAIINESSKIKINNCLISGGQISGAVAIGINFNNSNLTLNNNSLSGNIYYENIISLNSQINNTLTDNNFIIQKGSIYNYPNPIIPTLSSDLLSNDKDQIYWELKIPAGLDIINKKEFILKYYDEYPECKDQYGDGIGFIKNENNNLHFSANYLTNNKFAYWSSIYKGRFTEDSNIILNTPEEFHNFFKSIPRNLNGYTLTINSDLNGWIDNLLISNFYNGYIIFNTLSTNYDGLILNDNDCEIEFNTNLMPINNNLNDNKHIIFNCNRWKDTYDNKIRNYILKGDNNIIILNSKTRIDYIFDIYKLNYNSYGNYIEIKNKSIVNYKQYILKLDSINNGNMIYDKSNGLLLNLKNSLSNHSHKDFPNKDNIYLNDFRINDVRPKIYQDNSCIGSIIGWVKSNNNIPLGYYECNGATIPVNNFNPNDIYYNALLAYLMNATSSFTLPNLSSYNINGESLIYIIKYNNNFEHV